MPLPPELVRELSRDEVNALEIRRYEGEVRLVETPQELERAAGEWREERVMGFDTETRPAFRPGESYLPALAQLATARKVYLLPLQRLDCSGVLRGLLGAEHTIKVGVGMPDDFRALPRGAAARHPHSQGHEDLELGRAEAEPAANRVRGDRCVDLQGAVFEVRAAGVALETGVRPQKEKQKRGSDPSAYT
jgi:hypothetical protein